MFSQRIKDYKLQQAWLEDMKKRIINYKQGVDDALEDGYPDYADIYGGLHNTWVDLYNAQKFFWQRRIERLNRDEYAR